ncbi:MAG TPA: YhbY family RNA-binding protein [Candidatus Nanoarchaeia archaeon]|nr:YhbY family RNA-binding protein [Candidatus Nanoarchaeia archaeon]
MKEKIELRKQSKKLSPIINIGKSGLTANVVLSLDRLLKQRNLIKIRLLRAFFTGKNKEELIQELVQKTQSQLIDSVGNIVVIYKK